MGGVMVGDQTVMGSTGAEHEAARSFLMTGIGGTGTGVRGDASWSRDGRVSGAGRRRRAARCVESARGSAETGCARGSRGETTGTRIWMHVAGSWNAGGLSTAAREDAGLANGRLARRRSATMATLWPRDGCSVSCQIECGWECAGGGRRQRTCALQQGAGTRCWEGRRSAGRRQRGAVVHGLRGFIV